MKPQPRSNIRRTAACPGMLPLAALVVAACAPPEPPGQPGQEDRAPAAQALRAGPEDLVCHANAIMWDTPRGEASRCEGPWAYEQYAVRTMAHEDCGVHSCVEPEICTSWIDRTATYRDRNPLELFCDDTPREPGIGCRPDLEPARVLCHRFAASRRDWLNDQADRRNARILRAAIEVLPSARQVECTVEMAYEERTRRACGCEQWRYNECPHADPSLPRVTARSAPGRTLAEVRAAHVAEAVPGQAAVDGLRLECTTAEEPALSPQERFTRLHRSMQDAAIAPEGTPLRARLAERLRLVYELSGAELTPAQRAVAHALYESHPAAEPACGRHLPADVPSCRPQIDAALRLCTRLGSAHVSPALVEADYDACLALLTDLGAAIEAGTCARDAAYVEAGLAAHRRLHERLLARLGDALMTEAVAAEGEVPLFDPAPIARVLHAIDRWYRAMGVIVSDPDQRRAALALLGNQLWQVAHGHGPPDAAGRTWSRDSVYDKLTRALASADALLAQGNEAGARQAIEHALAFGDRYTRTLDQAILRAAYADVEGTGEPVLRGAPLLRITADALAPLADRLEALTPYHDLGCALARCATWASPTRLSYLWQALAHLDDGRDAPVPLGAVLDAMPDDLSGWRSVFRVIHAHQDRLLAAPADAPPGAARDLVDLIRQAEARAATYERTGTFRPTLGHTLQTGVHSAQRRRVLDHIDQQRHMLEAAHADLEQRLLSLVHGLVRVRDAGATRARLEAERARVRIEQDELGRREASYRRLIAGGAAPGQDHRAGDGEDALFEALMAGWARAEGGADRGAYLRLGGTQVLRLSGVDARFESWDTRSVAQVAAGMRAVEGGRVVSIATAPGSVWAPTCALRQVRLVDVDEAAGKARDAAAESLALDTTGAVTGPEGYTLTWTGSAFRATSRHAADTTRVTTGTSLRGCVGVPFIEQAGSSAGYCAYREKSRTQERGQRWQRGHEGRTSAQLAGGLYVPGTPFEAPAGSLVVVEMPPGETDPARLRDVHLVRAPHTTIALEDAADLYFVVNDTACDLQDSDHVIEVTAGTFVPLEDAAHALLRRMAHTLALVRARAPEVIARGGFLPAERSLLEQDALLAQLGGPGDLQIPVAQYPDALRNLFQRFLAREMVRLEAMAALATIEREQQINAAEHRAVTEALHQSTLAGHLLGLLPRWSARGLRLSEMQEVAAGFTRDIRRFVVPLLDLWYPDVATALPELDVLRHLANVDVDTPLPDLVAWQAALGRALRRRLAEARLPYPSDDDTARKFVVLRFPRPSAMDQACAHIPSARCPLRESSTTFRWATVAQANALWDALGDASAPGTALRRLGIRVQPEDLYEPYAGSAYLSCRRALPVVRKLGLVLTGMATSGTPPEQRFIEGDIPAPARLDFVTTSGIWPFALESPVWRALSDVPVFFTWDDYAAAETALLRAPQDVRGISPFTTFELVVPESVVQAWEMRDARSIDLVMELESIRTGTPVAVPACALDQEALRAGEATTEAVASTKTHGAALPEPQENQR